MPQDECSPVRRAIYQINFLFAASSALTSFFNAPLLLARGVPEVSLGTLYAGSAALGILALFFVPKFLNRFGGYGLFAVLTAVNAISFLILAIAQTTVVTLLAFLALAISNLTMALLLDMFLEGSTQGEGVTGRTRAFFMTAANLAWVGAPVIAGLITVTGFAILYTVAASLLVPVLFITAVSLNRIQNHCYDQPSLGRLFGSLQKNADVRSVFFAHFLLRMFYAVMVVYIPILLTTHIGFTFTQLGLILSTAMLAFLLFEWPIGKLADERWGEKEMMIGGFIVIAVSTGALAFITTPLVWVWGLALFVTRFGASLLEITTESYFFKHVDGNDADDVSAFRMLNPLAYIVGPLLASTALLITSVNMLFLLLGIFMLTGIPAALRITDTR